MLPSIFPHSRFVVINYLLHFLDNFCFSHCCIFGRFPIWYFDPDQFAISYYESKIFEIMKCMKLHNNLVHLGNTPIYCKLCTCKASSLHIFIFTPVKIFFYICKMLLHAVKIMQMWAIWHLVIVDASINSSLVAYIAKSFVFCLKILICLTQQGCMIAAYKVAW